MDSPFCSLSGVKVLSVEGPGCLQVRPGQWEREMFLLRRQLADYYTKMWEGLEVENEEEGEEEEEKSQEGENKIASSLRQIASIQTSAWVPGRLIAVHRGIGNWSRAVLLDLETGLNVSVWLVDEGKRISVKTHSIFPLATRFTTSQPLSLNVHLYNVSPGDVCDPNSSQTKVTKDMLSLLSRVDEVTLCRRGHPASLSEEHCQAFSLPVDLTWVEMVQLDPFLPSQQQEQSLVSALLERGLADVTVDLTLEEEPEETKNSAADTEFAHVEPLPGHMAANFRWLDPELPGTRTFYARGTHVDDSGQIWIQPHEGRHNVRLLRRLLNEKFSGSTPKFDPSSNSTCETESFSDSDKESFGVQQECCVKWRDGNWFRARVIKWLEVEGESRVQVLLVDWGNIYITSLMNLRSTIYGENIPIQAFSTELYNVKPVNSVWSEECLQHMLDSVLYDKGGPKSQKMRVTQQVEEGGMPPSLPLPVSICLPSELDLSDVLVELGEAQRVDLPLQVSSQLQAIRQEVEVRVGLLPPGHYTETNAHVLLSQPRLDPLLVAPVVNNRSKVTSWLCPEDNGVLEDEDGAGSVLEGFRPIDWEKAGVLEPGALLCVQLTEVESFTEVTVIVLPGTSSYLTEMYEELDKGLVQLQSQARKMPPLLHPRPGLSVVVLWDQREWHRAEVVQCTDTNCFVNFVDFGTKDWAQDSMLVREMPRKWRQVPALSTEVELLVRSMDEEMEPDILQAIMAECLYSKGEVCLYFRVEEVSDRGRLRGHFVDKETGQPVYRGLVKEGLIELVS